MSSEAKQAAFMDMLLDLVCLAQEAEFATSDSHVPLEPTRQDCCRVASGTMKPYFCVCQSGFTRLAEQMGHDRRLLNGLANQENVSQMWTSSCQLFPPDLMRLCHQQFDQTMARSGIPPQQLSRGRCSINVSCYAVCLVLIYRMRPPDSGKLETLVSEMSEQAASQQEILEELKQTVSWHLYTPTNMF